jgi:hypothetical protein
VPWTNPEAQRDTERVSRRDKEVESFEFGSSVPAAASATVQRRAWPVVITVLVLVAAAGGYLYLYQPQLLDKWLSKTPIDIGPTTTTVYKWQDARGNWQISDQPPPAPTAYEVLEYRSDTNVMPIAPRAE